jgi:hypothetical protein
MMHRSYKYDWLILGGAVLVGVASVFGDYVSESYNWFSRSGSIVVLLSVVVEYRISSHIYEDIQRADFQQSKINLLVPIKAKPTKQRKRVSNAAHFLLVLGTIIWGYGDLAWS